MAEDGGKNPWQSVPLEEYEKHMRLDSVRQLQTMHQLMRRQLTLIPAQSVMILGIAGGNGLDLPEIKNFSAIYGVDVNRAYLNACSARYPQLSGVFVPVEADLRDDGAALPQSELVIANLLIEYIGCECFARVLQRVEPRAVSCAIQADFGEGFVSDSPYVHTFDGVAAVHRAVQPEELAEAMQGLGYTLAGRTEYPLPNGKYLLQPDWLCSGAD